MWRTRPAHAILIYRAAEPDRQGSLHFHRESFPEKVLFSIELEWAKKDYQPF
jgi:hypothetical protein